MDDDIDNNRDQLTEKQVNAMALMITVLVLAIVGLTMVILWSK